jgi:hypothetical protein
MNNKDFDREDQVNLSALKFLVTSFLRGFFRFLSFLTMVARKRKFIMLTGLFLGLFFAMFYYYLAQTKYYQASMMVASSRLPNKAYAGIISQLNVLAKSGSTDRLAAELHITPGEAKSLVNFDSRTMTDEELENDTSTRLEGSFLILYGIRDVGSADTVQNALINYLNNLPYLRKLSEVERLSNTEKISRLENDLNRLDSLKLIYNKFLASSKISATFYNDAIEPAKIYQQSATLFEDMQQTRRRLYVENEAVSLIDPIKIANTTRSKSLPTLLVYLGFAGLLAGFLIGFMMETRKRLLP